VLDYDNQRRLILNLERQLIGLARKRQPS